MRSSAQVLSMKVKRKSHGVGRTLSVLKVGYLREAHLMSTSQAEQQRSEAKGTSQDQVVSSCYNVDTGTRNNE